MTKNEKLSIYIFSEKVSTASVLIFVITLVIAFVRLEFDWMYARALFIFFVIFVISGLFMDKFKEAGK